MRSNDGPQLLPPLVRGQQIRQGPYTVTVTDDMVRQVERENERRRRQWEERERRRQQQDAEYFGEFKEFYVRRRFIRRVFFILALQLLFTAAVSGYFIFVQEAKEFMLEYPGLVWVALLVFISTWIAVVCSDCARRALPCNILCLLLLTGSMSYTVAFSCIRYTLEWVLIAASITTFVVIVICCIATFTKFDLTRETGLLLTVSIVGIGAMIVMIIASFFIRIPYANIAFGSIGSLVISMYLFFDVQTLMGGRTIELEPDEVIYGAIMLYVDIILLFKYILMMGDRQ